MSEPTAGHSTKYTSIVFIGGFIPAISIYSLKIFYRLLRSHNTIAL